MHWLNALAILVMVGSGWRIYNNDPLFGLLTFPIALTLGGDPAITYQHNGDSGFSNALLWHFAFMWLLVVNGLCYLTYGVFSGRFRRMLFPIRPAEIAEVVRDTLRLKLAHADLTMYNAVQKLMYLGVIAAALVIVTSGVGIWKPIQFSGLVAFLGGFQGARTVHFLAMSAILAFTLVHVALALLVPRTLVSMLTGGPHLGDPEAVASASAPSLQPTDGSPR